MGAFSASPGQMGAFPATPGLMGALATPEQMGAFLATPGLIGASLDLVILLPASPLAFNASPEPNGAIPATPGLMGALATPEQMGALLATPGLVGASPNLAIILPASSPTFLISITSSACIKFLISDLFNLFGGFSATSNISCFLFSASGTIQSDFILPGLSNSSSSDNLCLLGQGSLL